MHTLQHLTHSYSGCTVSKLLDMHRAISYMVQYAGIRTFPFELRVKLNICTVALTRGTACALCICSHVYIYGCVYALAN